MLMLILVKQAVPKKRLVSTLCMIKSIGLFYRFIITSSVAALLAGNASSLDCLVARRSIFTQKMFAERGARQYNRRKLLTSLELC